MPVTALLPRQCSFQGRKQFSGFPGRQAGRQVPTFLGTVLLPRQSVQPPGRFSGFPGRQVLTFPGTVLLPRQSVQFPGKEAV